MIYLLFLEFLKLVVCGGVWLLLQIWIWIFDTTLLEKWLSVLCSCVGRHQGNNTNEINYLDHVTCISQFDQTLCKRTSSK